MYLYMYIYIYIYIYIYVYTVYICVCMRVWKCVFKYVYECCMHVLTDCTYVSDHVYLLIHSPTHSYMNMNMYASTRTHIATHI
jgi:hypothetical protein